MAVVGNHIQQRRQRRCAVLIMYNAMQFQGDPMRDAALYVWLGAGSKWEHLSQSKIRIGDQIAVPGDWIIKLDRGFVVTAAK